MKKKPRLEPTQDHSRGGTLLAFSIGILFIIIIFALFSALRSSTTSGGINNQINTPVEITKNTEWNVEWYTVTGDGKWGGKVGEQTFPATFFTDWGLKAPFGEYNDYIGFKATAYINVPVAGLVHFEIGSDDGSELFVDGNLVINNWKDHGYYDAGQPKKADVTLSKGKHKLTLNYYERGKHAAVSFKTDRDVIEWTETVYRPLSG